jgi:dipeptidyl aminopeptidase/acylaminoacyl peptidase
MLRKLLVVLALLPGTALAQATALDNGVPVTLENAPQDSITTFTLEVPAGMDKLVVILTGGEGDPELYVNFNEPYLASDDPTVECASETFGAEETCEIDNPLPGTWYIEVFGDTDYGSAPGLVALAAVELQDDVDEEISGAEGSLNWYFIDVPSGQGHLNVATSGGNGNPDLFIGLDLFGAEECASEGSGTTESCEIDRPAAGRWLVLVAGTAAYTNATLNAEFGTSRPDGPGNNGGGALDPAGLGGLLLLALLSLRRQIREVTTLFRPLVAVLLAGACGAAAAADAPTIADFARHPEVQNARLSPDGKHLAMTRMQNGRKVLQVLRLADRKTVGAFGLAGDRNIEDLYWPNDDHILFGASLPIGSLDQVTFTQELMQVRIDGSKPETFIKPRDSDFFNARDFEIVDLLDDDPDNILLSDFDDPSNWRLNNLYRLNLRTGLRSRLMQSRLLNGGFYSDVRQGVVRLQSGLTNANEIVYLARKSDGDSWQEIAKWPREQGGARFGGFGADPNQVYIKEAGDGAIDALFLLDLTTKARKLLFSSTEYEIDHLIYGRDRNAPIGVAWEGERTTWKFFDDKHPDAVLFQSLRKALGDLDLAFVNFSKDRSLALVAAGSDTTAKIYFVVDLAKPGLVARLPSRPWIDPAQMSPMRPIQYKARDGTTIHGYLTLPRNAKGPLPMVVYPHGGPFGVRDTWGFDSDVQLLASRGYAVLQPNFRGSEGYGGAFRKAGHGQWGKLMQDDVTDATRWAIQQGHADKDRICIYGASYGAYAAVESVAAEPDLYRCAIGYAGLYDLKMSQSASYSPLTRDYWKKVMDQPDLDARSPALHADRIKVPVFLVHGEDDTTCPIDQFKKMRKALADNRKTFEELVKDHEGHGFYDERNREEFYTRMVTFLDKHTAPKK